MEIWDDNNERTHKRLRLSHTTDCYISQSTHQGDVDDGDTGWEGGCGFGVERQEAPRLNPVEANKTPEYPTSDAHQLLTIDDRAASSKQLIQSTEDKPINFAACAESNIREQFQISPSNEHGGPKEIFAQQVCFGMVCLHLLWHVRKWFVDTFSA